MNDLKALKDLLKLLREKGVLEFENKDLKLKLSEEAPQSRYKQRQETEMAEDRELTEEELLYYSATPPLEAETQ
jgi:regulator of replication initiation timing